MRLGIDARLLTQTGVGVYTYNLLNFLPFYLPKEWEAVVFVRSADRHAVPFADRYTIAESNFRWHTLSEQLGFWNQLNKWKLDLMHFTYFSFPVLYRRPFISTIHDLTPVLFRTGKASTKSTAEYYPKYFAMKNVIAKAVKKSRAVITPTQFVKRQLNDLYNVNLKKVHAIPEGINEKLKVAKENKALKKSYKKPFFIYVGNFYPHKNVEKLVEVFSQVPDTHDLILIGPKDYFAGRIKNQIASSGLSERVHIFHNASLEDLAFFYGNAEGLIHPSLSEGFGLTLIEASYFGCPVIASNIQVFQETLGDSYRSFNPNDANSILEAIQKQITKKDDMEIPAIEDKFSFERMAEETVKVYITALPK
jgi:glycosyltransferase involved in cell wall biosynthesis